MEAFIFSVKQHIEELDHADTIMEASLEAVCYFVSWKVGRELINL